VRGFIPALALPKARIIRKLRGAMRDRRKNRPSPPFTALQRWTRSNHPQRCQLSFHRSVSVRCGRHTRPKLRELGAFQRALPLVPLRFTLG